MPVTKKGFTLIELLVVIAIIGLLSSVVLASLNTARSRARDAQRKSSLSQLATANELRYLAVGQYPASAGWLSNPGHGGLDAALTPNYIARIPDDPIHSGVNVFMYWRHDYNLSNNCSGISGGDPNKFGFYTRLENPSATDLATLATPFDQCVRTVWGVNYKKGN